MDAWEVVIPLGIGPARIEDDPAVPADLSDVRAIAVTAVGLLLVSLVALASGGSPWHAGGRQDVPVGVVSALAAAAGALVVGSLLLVWAGTPSVEKRRRRRRRLGSERPRGSGRRCRRPGRPLRSSAERSACSCSSLCRSSFPMRRHARRRARNAVPRGSTSTPAPARHPDLRHADVARRRLGGGTAPGRAGGSRRPSSARAARTSGGGSRCGGAGRLRPQAVARRPGVRARPAACRPSAPTRAWRSRSARSSSRAPDETLTEFTGRVLRVLGASAAAASDLTGLFEIARFSEHPMDEDDRRRAIASVRRVEAEVAPR